MKNLHSLLNAKRVVFHGQFGDHTAGAFTMRSAADGGQLRIIACAGEGWDHVSVSTPHRVPSWEEMEQVKHEFFLAGETAMQLHVPASEHINWHPYCLHIWRPHDVAIPRPPSYMVGPAPAPAAALEAVQETGA